MRHGATIPGYRPHWDAPTSYTTEVIRYRQRRRKACVLAGHFRGRAMAITILVHGSTWICHPSPAHWSWTDKGPQKRTRPPRTIRKAAKMAMRRWLNHRKANL